MPMVLILELDILKLGFYIEPWSQKVHCNGSKVVYGATLDNVKDIFIH